MQRISILGCGWLGWPLAIQLQQAGHFVRGSTTTPDKVPLLEEDGIEPWVLSLDPDSSGDELASFLDADTLITAIPPLRIADRVAGMRAQAELLIPVIRHAPVRRFIMVSSTGVYGSMGQDADENDPHPPDTETGAALLAMENLFLERLDRSVAIVRLAGLMGPGRDPGRFLAGKSVSGNGSEPVNMIHLNDATGVIQALVAHTGPSGRFNACAREHPDRQTFFGRASQLSGRKPPRFTDSDPRPWKRIVSEKIRKHTGYRFHFDDPVLALEALQK